MIIGLVVLFFVVMLYIYIHYGSVSTTLMMDADLNKIIDPISIAYDATSTNYSYGLWIYINTWDPNANKNMITNRGSLRLYLDKQAPVLKCDIKMSNGTVKTLEITDNFPIQKWTHVIISANNQFIDGYVNGKLMKSQRFYSPATDNTAAVLPATPKAKGKVILGNVGRGYDASVTGFKRWNAPMDPETAWDTYTIGARGIDFISRIYRFFSSLRITFDD